MAQLLCTFTKRNRLDETINEIKKIYNIAFNKIYILENVDNNKELLCTYNIDSKKDSNATMRNTISIHRKKYTNTLYTINALNYIVCLLNDGKLDPDFEVDWSNYKNTLLVADDNGLKKIKTKIYQIINI